MTLYSPPGWRISDTTADHVLEQIEQASKASRSRRAPAAVFDLDGTVFEVKYRSLGILSEWLTKTELTPFSENVVKSLRAIDFKTMGYDLESAFANMGLFLTDPEVAAVYESAQAFWKQRFFDGGSLLEYDEPVPGAAAFLKRVQDIGVRVLYLSGRHTKRMRDNTILQLKRHGMPVDDTTLKLKESPREKDTVYKPRAFRELADRWHVLANFENEYVNLHAMLVNRPEPIVPVIVDTPHSAVPVPPLPCEVLRIQDFR